MLISFFNIYLYYNSSNKQIMGHDTLITKGKRLSFLLRHDIEYNFDKNGWREIKDLIKNHNYTFDELVEIVDTDDKKRYEFNSDKTKIRARQGHSIDVDVELKETIPTDILYHGTATKFLESIYDKGILKCKRKYVHLSKDEETAVKVGQRHGKPFVLKIDAKKMVEDGCKFYLSNNDVWLTDYIDKKYIIN